MAVSLIETIKNEEPEILKESIKIDNSVLTEGCMPCQVKEIIQESIKNDEEINSNLDKPVIVANTIIEPKELNEWGFQSDPLKLNHLNFEEKNTNAVEAKTLELVNPVTVDVLKLCLLENPKATEREELLNELIPKHSEDSNIFEELKKPYKETPTKKYQ
jgi:hypothetical protein